MEVTEELVEQALEEEAVVELEAYGLRMVLILEEDHQLNLH